MVKRRKVLIGAGSLLAGGAAAMGTGAVTETDMERGLTGQVAGDAKGYIRVGGGYSNGQHVTVNGDGTIALDFGSMSGGGAGLNADSTNYFDGLLRVGVNDLDNDQYDQERDGSEYPNYNQDDEPEDDADEYVVWITENTNANGRIDFYRSGNPSSTMVGPNNAARIHDGSMDVEIGVCIDLSGTTLGKDDSLSQLFGSNASFTIHVERVNGPGNGSQAAPSAN